MYSCLLEDVIISYYTDNTTNHIIYRLQKRIIGSLYSTFCKPTAGIEREEVLPHPLHHVYIKTEKIYTLGQFYFLKILNNVDTISSISWCIEKIKVYQLFEKFTHF